MKTNSLICLSDRTLEGIKDKINRFLKECPDCKPVDLILPADGNAVRFDYNGFSVRKWYHNNLVRYDVAMDINTS